jgi:hypothetical protein
MVRLKRKRREKEGGIGSHMHMSRHGRLFSLPSKRGQEEVAKRD